MASLPVDRHIRSRMNDEFQLTLPKRWLFFRIVFLSIGLGGWSFGEVMAFDMLRSDPPPMEFYLAMLAWIAFWTFMGGSILTLLVWVVAGRERVRVEQGVLIIEQKIGPVGRQRGYDLRQLTGLRMIPQDEVRSSGQLLSARLAFEYGSQTVRWGFLVGEADAQMVVERLAERGVNRASA